MKFFSYGICLERLTLEKSELLRTWRNSSQINRFMEYRGNISPEMQAAWFQKINNPDNYYFIVNYHDKDVGMIHCSDIDWKRKRGHSGLFMWEPGYIDTYAPVLASLSLLDLFFNAFKLEYIEAKVKKDNDKAVQYNSALGFEIVEGQKAAEFQDYVVTRTGYAEMAARLRRAAIRVSGAETKLVFEPRIYPVDGEIIKKLKEINKKTSAEYLKWVQ